MKTHIKILFELTNRIKYRAKFMIWRGWLGNVYDSWSIATKRQNHIRTRTWTKISVIQSRFCLHNQMRFAEASLLAPLAFPSFKKKKKIRNWGKEITIASPELGKTCMKRLGVIKGQTPYQILFTLKSTWPLPCSKYILMFCSAAFPRQPLSRLALQYRWHCPETKIDYEYKEKAQND